MPKGRTLKREAKKPKKNKNDCKVIEPLGIFATAKVDVVRKRRKEREDILEE